MRKAFGVCVQNAAHTLKIATKTLPATRKRAARKRREGADSRPKNEERRIVLADVYDSAKRSEIMSKVKSNKNKSTELRLIELFRKRGVTGWRRNYPVKGKPDFVFLSKRIAVFVDGCFWHGHDCRNTRPASHKEFWDKKRERNMARDREVTARFTARGWKVIRIWECELKKRNEDALIEKWPEIFYPDAPGD